MRQQPPIVALLPYPGTTVGTVPCETAGKRRAEVCILRQSQLKTPGGEVWLTQGPQLVGSASVHPKEMANDSQKGDQVSVVRPTQVGGAWPFSQAPPHGWGQGTWGCHQLEQSPGSL